MNGLTERAANIRSRVASSRALQYATPGLKSIDFRTARPRGLLILSIGLVAHLKMLARFVEVYICSVMQVKHIIFFYFKGWTRA